ncbi:MAG: TIGR01777 family oxidoreductase, partial [Thermocrispum sp.]
MRVLVAGSSGFLGCALVSELREHGHEVRRLVRRAPAADDEHRWDPPAGSIADGALDGVDAVVNLCGSPMTPGRWTEARKQAMKDSRVEPTEVLSEAMAEHGIGTLVNASGIDFYGDTGDVEVDESAGEGAGFLAGLAAEWELATQAAQDAGARVVRLRTGMVLAPGGGMLRILKPLFLVGLGGKLGDGRQYVPWISRPDHAAAMRFAVENDALRGPVNLVAPNPVTNAEFTLALGKALRRPAPWFVPKPALSLVLGGDAVEPIMSSHNARPKALADAGFV